MVNPIGINARIPVQDDINHDILEVCNQNFIGNTFLNENELAKNSEFFSYNLFYQSMSKNLLHIQSIIMGMKDMI